MKRTELENQTGLNETELDTLLNKLSQLSEWEGMIDTMAETVDEDVAQFIILNHTAQAPNHKRISAGKVSERNTPFDPKKTPNEKATDIKPMSIDETALDLMEPQVLAQKATSAIDQQRQTYQTNRENARTMRAGIVDEGLIQRRIEGETVAELEAYEYLDSYHNRFQEILEDYSDYRYESHNQFMQGVATKGAGRNSEQVELRAKKLAERAEQYKKVSKAIQGKFKG